MNRKTATISLVIFLFFKLKFVMLFLKRYDDKSVRYLIYRKWYTG